MFVPGRPMPQGSKSFKGLRGGKPVLVESSDGLKPWREAVAKAAHLRAAGLLGGPVGVDLVFVMPRPKSTPKRATPPAVKRPDLDKLTRAILDALTGVWFDDDSAVTMLTASKRIAEIGERAGVHIAAHTITPADTADLELADRYAREGDHQ